MVEHRLKRHQLGAAGLQFFALPPDAVLKLSFFGFTTPVEFQTKSFTLDGPGRNLFLAELHPGFEFFPMLQQGGSLRTGQRFQVRDSSGQFRFARREFPISLQGLPMSHVPLDLGRFPLSAEPRFKSLKFPNGRLQDPFSLRQGGETRLHLLFTGVEQGELTAQVINQSAHILGTDRQRLSR